jgi:hypothetical protein
VHVVENLGDSTGRGNPGGHGRKELRVTAGTGGQRKAGQLAAGVAGVGVERREHACPETSVGVVFAVEREPCGSTDPVRGPVGEQQRLAVSGGGAE